MFHVKHKIVHYQYLKYFLFHNFSLIFVYKMIVTTLSTE